MSAAPIIHVAAFAFNGELVGEGQWRLNDLNARWLATCRAFLAAHGPSFTSAFPAPLDHLELKLTGAQGAALATYSVHGQVAASAAYLRGENLTAEQALLEMFVQSLRRTPIVQQSQSDAAPFGAVLELRARPLHVVVSWGTSAISDDDHELVTELGNHMAAAFLCG